MASRMDRYSKSELVSSGRSSKNKRLYEQIKDLDTYTNIEGIASIEKTNEIDISKVKEFINNRESYKKQKKLKDIKGEEEKAVTNDEEKFTEEEEREYNLNDLFMKLKSNDDKSNKYRSLNDEQYKELKKLDNKKSKSYDIEKEEEELKELVNTITTTRSFKDESDDVGLLDDLKSNTMVGSADSIKKIIEDEKSFYTSSFGFTSKDFDELKDVNQKIKKGNKSIITLLIILIFIILGVAVYIICKSI